MNPRRRQTQKHAKPAVPFPLPAGTSQQHPDRKPKLPRRVAGPKLCNNPTTTLPTAVPRHRLTNAKFGVHPRQSADACVLAAYQPQAKKPSTSGQHTRNSRAPPYTQRAPKSTLVKGFFNWRRVLLARLFGALALRGCWGSWSITVAFA